MKWAELSIAATKPTEEILANILCEEGSKGTIFSTDRTGRTVVSGFLPVNDFLDGRVRRIKDRIRVLYEAGQLPTGKLILRCIDDKDWAEAWKDHFQIERVTERIVICPGWRRTEYYKKAGDIPIYLDPGMAFGTGTHPTTVLCLAALEKYLYKGDLIYDVGTGSGILAIAAAKLGAHRVVALDLDEMACTVARKNVHSNGVEDRIEVKCSDLLHGVIEQGEVQIILANIIMEVIKEMIPDAERVLAPGGVLIASGITLDKLETIYGCLAGRSLNVLEDTRSGEWAALVLKKEAV